MSGERITLVYQGLHPYLEDDSEDPGSVPEEHLELLVLFVRHLALQELVLTAAASSPETGLDGGLLRQVEQARQDYRDLLQVSLERMGDTAAMQWRMDRFDRFY